MTKFYKVKITSANYNQLATGIYGSDNLPPAFSQAAEEKDADFFIKHAVALGTLTKKGTFRTKRDAIRAVNNLEKYNFFGIGWAAALGKQGFNLIAKVEQL